MWSRSLAILLVTFSLTALLGTAPGNAAQPTPAPLLRMRSIPAQPPPAQPTPTQPTPTQPLPVPPTPTQPTPDTSECPNRLTPPPAVDLSEVPSPGTPVPEPLPVPDRPVGGPRMGECGVILPGGAPPLPEGISATSWLLADGDTGEVLAAKDPHGRQRPASTIKLLTALLTADRLPAEQVVIATQEDADQEGSRVGIGPGGQYTVRQLLTGLLLVSGNDAAHALAGQLGGVPAALAQMKDLATALGAWDTRAATPSGLDGPGMSTSAYDLALVFRQVLHHPLLAEVLHTAQAQFPGFSDRPEFTIGNDNKLLMNYPGALGGKTGFTDDARHTYIGAAVRDGRTLIVVLMRGEQHPVPMWQQATRLLDYGFTLPRSRPVGVLVEQAPQPETATLTPAAARPAEAHPAGTEPASHVGADNQLGGRPSTLLITAAWIGLATLVLVVLGALLIRQRRRPHP